MEEPLRRSGRGRGSRDAWRPRQAPRRGSRAPRAAGQVCTGVRRGAGRAQVHTEDAGRGRGGGGQPGGGRRLSPAFSRVAPSFPRCGGACPRLWGLLRLPRLVTPFGSEARAALGFAGADAALRPRVRRRTPADPREGRGRFDPPAAPHPWAGPSWSFILRPSRLSGDPRTCATPWAPTAAPGDGDCACRPRVAPAEPHVLASRRTPSPA